MVLFNPRIPNANLRTNLVAISLPATIKVLNPYLKSSIASFAEWTNLMGTTLVKHAASIGLKADEIAHMWLEYARVNNTPVMTSHIEKDDQDAFNSILERIPAPTNRCTVLTASKQKQCENTFRLIDKMTKDSSLHDYRDLAAAEVLCKQFAMSGAQEGDTVTLPCVDANNNSVMIEYEVYKKCDLAESEIPVYVLRPKKEEDQLFYEPILLFRGTCPDSDVRSLLENMDTEGPARRIYEQSLPKIKELMDELYPLDKPHNKPKVRVMGYSQGGVLGQRAVVDFADQVSQDKPSIFFNSAGIEQDYKDRWDAIPEDKRPRVQNYIVSRDPISKAGDAFVGELYEIVPEENNDMVNAHFGCKLLESGWKIYKLDPEKEAQCPTRKMVNRIRTDQKVETVYAFLMRNIHYLDAVAVKHRHK